MATLEHLATGEPFVPDARTLVGRAATCGRVLPGSGVSGEHALLRWTGEEWTVRDLGSRNGTFVDEVRIQPGQELPLTEGARVRFGIEAQTWVVLDVDPPSEIPTSKTPLPPTREVTRRAELAGLGLQIRVSRDEEYVEIDLITPDGPERLAPRAWHDLYLLLGRERLEQRPTASEAEEGWVHMDDLCKGLGRSRERVNVEVYRARQQLAELGIADAVDAFERRPTTRQIRLGFARLTVERL